MDTDSSRYKAFWIMGDGNFIAYPDQDRAGDEATLNQYYTFGKYGEFQTSVVLVEKKSNKEPPGYTNRILQVTPPPTNAEPVILSGFPFTSTIQSPDRMSVVNSSKTRLGGYATALAVSSLFPSASNTNQTVLLFYNSVKVQQSEPFFKATLFPLDQTVVKRANYNTASTLMGSKENLPAVFGSFVDGQGYKNVIVQPATVQTNLKSPGFSEFRVFPILHTKPKQNPTDQPYSTEIPLLDQTGRGETQFLALLLEGATANPAYNAQTNGSPLLLADANVAPSSLTDAEKARIRAVISAHAPQLMVGWNEETLCLSNGMYIRGAVYATNEVVSSIDPTELRVLQIKSKTPDTYEVNMRLTVCNEGNMGEPHVGVRIDNMTGVQILEPQFEASGLRNFGNNIEAEKSVWSFDYMQGLPPAYNALGVYKPSCFERDFSFVTDKTGADKMAVDGALKAVITFNSAFIRPVQEYPSLNYLIVEP